MSKKILFIINKFAGKGFEPRVEGKIIDTSAQYGYECTLEFTQYKGHATQLAKTGVDQHFDKIVAVGGDGTVNEVAQALVHQKIPMGIIPKGSGNGLSRHTGIPLDYTKALENVFIGNSVCIDTFLVNEKLSLNVSGFGFDGHIANLFGKDGKRGLGGYIKLVLKEFFSFKPFAVSYWINEQNIKTELVFIAAFANSSQYGNNARIAPQASLQDGKLHVVFIKQLTPFASLSFLQKALMGKIHQSKLCLTLETEHIQCRTEKNIPYHIDGEASGFANNFSVKVLPKSLLLLVPATAHSI
ncbi:MAG: diacylglycerol/lipid kinase family protein [Chryseotalea sp.]